MTQEEKQEILDALRAESTDLTELPVAQSLIDVTCLPSLQGDSLVRAPLSLLAEPALHAAERADAATDAADEATRQANAATLAARNAMARTNEATTAAQEATTAAEGATRQAAAGALAARVAAGEAAEATGTLSDVAERASGAAEAADTAAQAALEAADGANAAAAAASLAARTMIMEIGGFVERVTLTGAMGSGSGTGEVVYDSQQRLLCLRVANPIPRYYRDWPDREAWCDDDGTPLPGKLYIDTSDSSLYRWDGTALVRTGGREIVTLTEDAYDALEPDDNIIYMIYEDD